MSELLKINRNGQIPHIALDRRRPMRSIPLDSSLGLAGRMMAPGGYSSDDLLLAVALYADTPPYSIEGMCFCTINQIESTDK